MGKKALKRVMSHQEGRDGVGPLRNKRARRVLKRARAGVSIEDGEAGEKQGGCRSSGKKADEWIESERSSRCHQAWHRHSKVPHRYHTG